jgi:alkanesulfonate monooxygenase SsuD/methylene tetrahydromethanopterin reductase-like flavin-dependent oxidoreductase (luciferase family)
MAGANVVVAQTDAEARRLFTSIQQQFANLVRRTPGRLPPPIDDIDSYWSRQERAQASTMLSASFIGSPETVRAGLTEFAARTAIDELIVASAIYEHEKRLRSYELLIEAMR